MAQIVEAALAVLDAHLELGQAAQLERVGESEPPGAQAKGFGGRAAVVPDAGWSLCSGIRYTRLCLNDPQSIDPKQK